MNTSWFCRPIWSFCSCLSCLYVFRVFLCFTDCLCGRVFFQWHFIDLFSCIAASLFNKLTFLLTYLPVVIYGEKNCKSLHVAVLFCSSAVLDPRVGHTMYVLSPFISVLCHSDWLFHGESCPRLDVVHPRAYPADYLIIHTPTVSAGAQPITWVQGAEPPAGVQGAEPPVGSGGRSLPKADEVFCLNINFQRTCYSFAPNDVGYCLSC